MNREGLVDVFYYTQPVDSVDQAASLTGYLGWHGFPAFADDTDQVLVPLEDPTRAEIVHTLVGTWRLFWESSDSGVFDLPIYSKD